MVGIGPSAPRPALAAPVPLGDDHDTTNFDCGSAPLNEWLSQRARKSESRFSRTYVVCEIRQVIAYYCISAGAVERSSAPSRLRRNAPNTIPVSIIGRLAVSRLHQGQSLGTHLLADALRRIAIASQTIGIGAVLVQAKDDDAKRFYLSRSEFQEYPSESRTLYMPIDTLIAAFS